MRSRSSRSGFPRGLRARVGTLAVLALLATTGVSVAAEPARSGDEPGVARVSLIEGDASYLRGDADDWTGVSVNAPLVTGDQFYSGSGSRAEIQLAPAVYARLSSETELSMLELGPEATQVRLTLGLASFRVRRDPGGRHVEIDTPGAAIVVREAGVYRVAVDRDGNTNLQVREGEGAVHVGDERYRLVTGRGANITGTGSSAQPSLYSIEGGDAWDEWEAQRAQRVDSASSYRYVSEDIYGAEDLDQYGDWQETPEYGQVWRPRDVGEDWAPYTDGRWVWVDPWGWTWMDYSPWGWAPYHYGRWVNTGGYWGWAPGPIIASPIYAPALVGWYGGWGGGVSVSVGFGFGFGSIGWVPLGWGEPCFPWWGGWGGVVVGSPWWGGWGGPRVVNNFYINKNITNININEVNFGNLRHRGGFSTVPVKDFLNGRGGRTMPVGTTGNPRDFKAIGGRVPVVPTRGSLPATNPSRVPVARSAQPPGDVTGRGVVTARTPTTSGQPSFERKLPVVERNRGAPLTPANLREMGGSGGPLTRNVAASGAGNENGGRTLPGAEPGATGEGGRTLPGADAREQGAGAQQEARSLPFERGGDGAQRGSAPEASSGRDLASRGGADDAGGRSLPARQSMTIGGRGGDGAETTSRSVPRPPALSRGGDGPVAPREGGSRQPYVARRPSFDGSPTGGEGGSSRSGSVPRSNLGSPDSDRSASGSSPTMRSSPGGSAGRDVQSAPRSRSYGPAGPPTTRSAPSARDGSSRSYFSQPRTLSRPRGDAPSRRSYAAVDPRTRSGSRAYAPQTRSAPSQRGYRAPSQRGYGAPSQRGSGAPQMRSAPSQRSSSAPRTYSAPQARSAPSTSAPRSYSAPSSGFGRSAPSAPAMRSSPGTSGMSRGFSSGGGSRSFGGSLGGGGMRGGGGGMRGGGGGGGGGGRVAIGSR